MFKRTKLSACALLALGGAVGLSALPAYAQQETQRIEVTGSRIKRVDSEGVSPVDVITREQIERTGQPTAAEVLRNLPINTGSFGESFSNSFAPGAAGISLRGLGQKTTLVLINGRRTAGYGFAQNLQDTFVDLNAIPSSAVERIEILKDGASAIYGSDAIAGVVNVILRSDYRGAEVGGTIGSFEGKGDARMNAVFGYGDQARDKFNVFGAVDFYKRDLLLQKDTEFLKTRDFRGRAGGRNFQSLNGGGTWRQLSATGALTNTFRAISECPGFVLTGPQAVDAGLINPVGATNLAQAAATNTWCARDFNSQFTALPGTERLNAYLRGNFDVGPNLNVFSEVGYSHTVTEQTFQSTFFAGTTGLQQTSVGLRPFTYNVNFLPGVAGNPFATNARYTGVLNDFGTRDNEITSDATRLLLGAKYTFGSWSFESGFTTAQTKTESQNFNRLSLSGVSAAFGVPTTPQPPIPTSTATAYNLDRWSTNSAALRDSMQIDFPRQSTSKMTGFDTKADTQIGNLPGGPIGVALGVEYREESLKDRPDPAASSGQVLGQGITATDGSRKSAAAFVELSLPITKQLEAQLAARHDKYSDYGSSSTPKIGFKYKPVDGVLLRANWGKGFRAPTLPEISPSVATFFTTVIDPEDDTSRQISGVFAGNPNLKAETSESMTLGLVIEPTKDVSFGVSLYKLDWRNVVASRALQDIVDESCPTDSDGAFITPCPSTAAVVRDPTTNLIVIVNSNYQNLQQRVTSGIDLDGRISFSAPVGKVTLAADVTYIHSFKEDGVEYAGSNGGTNTIPRVRAGARINLDRGPWAFTLSGNYTHSVKQELLAASFFTNQDPRFQTGTMKPRVSSLTRFDFFTRYEFSKKFTISGSILNVLNKLPPYDPGFSSTSLHDFSLHDVRGRQYRISAKYVF